ncbi:MAG: saccharopine dehydrogenase NADP-binding domain-containing protein [Legionellaceae bacterium]|nr:saccharopine dehydrogenase NADP-binding domain-containing protein [Legionellaceae bacterium]
MIDVLVCGAGRIGMAVAAYLATSDHYRVHLADVDFSDASLQRFLAIFETISTVAIDVQDSSSLIQYFARHHIKAVISCLPSEYNPDVALAAREMAAHYFDLGESVSIAKKIREIAQGADSAFVIDCGCAPGFVGLITHDLLQQYERCISAEVRVGVLQQSPSTSYDVAADCSINRIIAAYSTACTVIENNKLTEVAPLSGLEEIDIDGQHFEAFYTAGGLGHLIPAYDGKIERFDYKSIHVKGHCSKMGFLLHELNLDQEVHLLRQVLRRAPAEPAKDQILIAIKTQGMRDGEMIERQYHQQLLPIDYGGIELSAMQSSTAAGVCAVLDLIMQQPNRYKGLITPEAFSLSTVLANPFASYYAK